MAEKIQILLVDDIDEVRENVRRLLAFEPDFEVIASTASGREGVKLAKEVAPDIIIMDINMPDIDGISATEEIKRAQPATGVIMMSVNSDPDYMRRAMMAGASNFLTKPANMDDLYHTIRTVYEAHAPQRYREDQITAGDIILGEIPSVGQSDLRGNRLGHVIAIYSPKGGSGKTTVAINLAASLLRDDTHVLLIDADVQFGDVGVFLNLKPQSTITDLIEQDVDEIDVELFQNIVSTHGSGLKVLLAPPRPEDADAVFAKSSSIKDIIGKVRRHYDFVIVDTSSRLDELTAAVCDIADEVFILTTPTLPSIRSARSVLDLFDQVYGEHPGKIKIILNMANDDRAKTKANIPLDRIIKHLGRDFLQVIPNDSTPILQSILKGVPAVVAERDTSKTPVAQFIELASKVRIAVLGEDVFQDAQAEKKTGGFPFFGR